MSLVDAFQQGQDADSGPKTDLSNKHKFMSILFSNISPCDMFMPAQQKSYTTCSFLTFH